MNTLNYKDISFIFGLLAIIFLFEHLNIILLRQKCRDNDMVKRKTRADIILQVSHSQVRYDDEDEDEGPQPDPMFEAGAPIPVRLHNEFPPELASTPLEDIDSFYHNQRVPGIDALISLTLLKELSFREMRNNRVDSNERPLMPASGIAILKLWLSSS